MIYSQTYLNAHMNCTFMHENDCNEYFDILYVIPSLADYGDENYDTRRY